jgi:hypothetical protein
VTLAIIVVVAMVVVAGLLLLSRRPRQDEGLTSFRRHIDALSPEARRDVQERVRRREEGRG